MENGIYRRVIHELSTKSEKDYGFKRVVDEKTKITQYIVKGVYVLFQFIIIIAVSSFFAIKTLDLISNLYIVIVCVSILGVLNYPYLWKKFTRKRIIIFIILFSILISLMFFVPANLIPQANDELPLFMAWGIRITVISIVIYYLSYAVVTLTELLLDLASVFLPILPATFGGSLKDLALETYEILYSETAEKATGENDLKYLISASQADIDSAGIRSLPWVVILGFGATSFSDTLKGIFSFDSFVGFSLLLIGLLAIFNMARMTYFQTLIIQVANRLLIDISNNKKQEELNNFVVVAKNDKPGCLLRILLPWKI